MVSRAMPACRIHHAPTAVRRVLTETGSWSFLMTDRARAVEGRTAVTHALAKLQTIAVPRIGAAPNTEYGRQRLGQLEQPPGLEPLMKLSAIVNAPGVALSRSTQPDFTPFCVPNPARPLGLSVGRSPLVERSAMIAGRKPQDATK